MVNQFDHLIEKQGKQFRTILEGLRGDKTMRGASSDARGVIYERSLDKELLDLAGKLFSGSIRIKRQTSCGSGRA